MRVTQQMMFDGGSGVVDLFANMTAGGMIGYGKSHYRWRGTPSDRA
jgi:hypothetical protein